MTTALIALLGLTAATSKSPPRSSQQAFVLAAPVPMTLRWIEGGAFRMGDLAGLGQEDERPVRPVTVSGFWIMDTEVTVAMFGRFVAEVAYKIPAGCGYFAQGWKFDSALSWQTPGFVQSAEHPVVCVGWDDATAFADWLSQDTGFSFSLPSESQWEYAARAGTATLYGNGNGNDATAMCSIANGADRQALAAYPDFDVNDCDDGYIRTAPVSSYAANNWGLHDMTGNVWEWISDCWPADYANAPTDGTPSLKGNCERRGYRGGGYGDVPFYLRIALRNRGKPNERRDDVGFRLVMNP